MNIDHGKWMQMENVRAWKEVEWKDRGEEEDAERHHIWEEATKKKLGKKRGGKEEEVARLFAIYEVEFSS